MKVAVFGAGEYGHKYIERMGNEVEITCVADNNRQGELCMGYRVISADELMNINFDECVICLNDYTNLKAYDAMDDIILQLQELGIPDDKIKLQNVWYDKEDGRICFLREYSRNAKKLNLGGCIAECGVMRGHFAHYISSFFRQRKFYLFDTFTGLDERDIKKEPDREEWLRTRGNLYLSHGNEGIAVRRCVEPDRVIVRKGYIPDTFKGLENERFIFVNIDMDVYAPTISSLRFFFSRMTDGGVILCHDYFNPMFPGIKQAIDEFEQEEIFLRIPVRDGDSLCIVPSMRG